MKLSSESAFCGKMLMETEKIPKQDGLFLLKRQKVKQLLYENLIERLIDTGLSTKEAEHLFILAIEDVVMEMSDKQFEPENMTKIKFVFDKSDKGSIYLTNIGIRKEFSD